MEKNVENVENKETNIDTKKINKLYIIIPIIIAIITIISSIIFFKAIDKNYKIEEVSEYLYFKSYEDNKYGIIDKSGKELISANYDMIIIPNPSKDIFICYYDYNSQEGDYKTKVFNKDGEELFKEYEQVLPLIFKEYTTEIPYEKTVLKYKENNKYGLIDFSGKKITQPIYDEVESLLYKEGCLLIQQNEKYGVINIEGKEIVKIQYDSITADGYYNENTQYKAAGFIIGNKYEDGYRYGYINYKGNILLDTQYNEVNRVSEITDDNNVYLLAFKNGQAGLLKNKNYIVKHEYEEIEYNSTNELFILQKGSKQGVIDKQGKEILPIEYNYILFSNNEINAQKDGKIYNFDTKGNKEEKDDNITKISTQDNNYFVTIDENDKFGIIDRNNNIIAKNIYQYIEYAYNGYFIATNTEGKIGVLNTEGKLEINFKYNVIQRIENKNILQCIKSQENIIEILDNNLNTVASMKDSNVEIKSNYIKVFSENDRKYFDNNGKEIKNSEIFVNNELFAYKDENNKWGFIDKLGNKKVDTEYEMVTEFNSYGFAGIKKNGKWGVIDTNGSIIVEPIYSIDWKEPEFIGKYCKLNFGYGLVYYTDKL